MERKIEQYGRGIKGIIAGCGGGSRFGKPVVESVEWLVVEEAACRGSHKTDAELVAQESEQLSAA